MEKPLNHLAVIMDGNRRWAKEQGLELLKGHYRGADTLEKISRAAFDHKIGWLTTFAFSSENWLRPANEVSGLLALMKKFITTQSRSLIDNNVRLRVVGRRDRFSANLQYLIKKAEQQSETNTGLNLTVALDYGGRQDIAAAAKQIACEVENGLLTPSQVNDDLLKSRLLTKVLPSVDLLIRTGGEKRISNFMLWDLSYAELYFTDKYWPEFSENDLLLAVNEYYMRDRRFGKNSDKIHRLRMVQSDLA